MEFSIKEALALIITLAIGALVILAFFRFGPLADFIISSIESCL